MRAITFKGVEISKSCSTYRGVIMILKKTTGKNRQVYLQKGFIIDVLEGLKHVSDLGDRLVFQLAFYS